MSRLRQEEVLLAELRKAFGADKRDFSAQSDWPSGVLILSKGRFRGIWCCRDGHYRGVWHWMDGNYAFTPGGYGNSTHAAPTPQDAVSFTLNHVCRQ